jgi:multiple antibiotic resistance protein
MLLLNPLMLAPVFIGLTAQYTPQQSRTIALKGCIFAFAMLALAAMIGQAMFASIGISIDALRIAGGMLLFHSAFYMVTSSEKSAKDSKDEEGDISIFPIGFPFLAGPATLVFTMTYVADAPVTYGYYGKFVVVSAIALVMLILFVSFVYGGKFIASLLGKVGLMIMKRVLGILLVSLAVQMILGGGEGVIRSAFERFPVKSQAMRIDGVGKLVTL